MKFEKKLTSLKNLRNVSKKIQEETSFRTEDMALFEYISEDLGQLTD